MIRTCVDPTNSNKAIACEPFYNRTPDDIHHRLSIAEVLTKVYFTKDYWYIELDNFSSCLATFNTT